VDAYELVVFDWDGTMVDSTRAITDSMREAAKDLGLPVPSVERARHVIGMGLLEAIHYAVPGIERAALPKFVERYRAHYLQEDAFLKPFDGIPALLQELEDAGVMLAIATGKSRAGLDRALTRTGWGRHFMATRTGDEGAPKPDPWMLADLCSVLSTPPERVVMIGDTTHDLGMARAAGTAAVAVTYGAHPEAELRAMSPAACVHTVSELREWLLPRLRPIDSRESP
jgi:phosphoglycolate phosphatase